MKSRTWSAVIGLALGIVVVSEVGDAWARARGGGGGSGRGSRSYSAPARPTPNPASPTTPSSPSRSLNQPAAPAMPSRPSFFGGLMGGIAGFALGGLLGSMLFGGLGHGLGGLGGGIGLMDILLIGGGLALLVMFLRRRRAQQEPQPAYAGMGGGYRAPVEPVPAPTATVTATPVEEVSDVDRGLGHITSMDRAFDSNALTSFARDAFFDVQAAVSTKDMSRVRDKITPEMYSELQAQCDQARAAGRTNRLERVDLRRSEITEAWQETGRDYVTVCLAGSLIDYTVEDATGNVVAGSATQRENLEEFWTFTRPVGPGAWRLSAIQS